MDNDEKQDINTNITNQKFNTKSINIIKIEHFYANLNKHFLK